MRRLSAAVLAAVVVLGLPGCGGKTDEASRAAGITPRAALAFVSVNLDPSVEQKRNLLGIARRFPGARDTVKGEFEDARDRLLSDLVRQGGLDFRTDVRPWLGDEVAVAVLPPGGGGSPMVTVMVESEDDAKAKAAIEKSRSAGNFRGDYRMVGDFVVISDQEALADNGAVLDRFAAQAKKGDGGLAKSDRFAGVIDQLRGDRLVLVWADAKEGLRTAQELGAVPGAELFEQLGDAGPFAFDLHVTRSAVVVEGVATSPGKEEPAGGEPELTAGLPADSLGALTVFDAGSALLKGLDVLSGLGGGGDVVSEFQRQTGVDLRADLFSWMKGELVVVAGAVPSGQPFPDFALVVEPSDRAAAEAGVAKIRDALARQGAVLEERQVAGSTAYVVPQPLAQGVQPAMALFRDRFVIANRPEYLEAVARTAPSELGGTEAYESLVGEGSKETSVQLVVLIDPIREAIERALPAEERAEYEREARPNLEPLAGFGMVVGQDGEYSRVEMKLSFD